jgi:hypothetical protein
MESSGTGAQATTTNTLTAFNTNGFSLGVGDKVNQNGITYASWTFRKQPKFFDVVTYTGNGTNNRTISHNLGSTPGSIFVKRTDAAGAWYVFHRSLSSVNFMVLNTTAALAGAPAVWDGAPTSTTFTIQDETTNINNATYVAYLFAHDAGGFGLTGTDNVISCGSFTTDGSGNATVNLGYEPQWILFKASSRVLNWSIHDTMRGMPVGSVAAGLYPNLSDAESNNVTSSPTATGFTWSGYANETFVYVAIRRGPMKVPTLGTSVFSPISVPTSNALVTGNPLATGFPVDLTIATKRTKVAISSTSVADRLRGTTQTSFPRLTTNGTGQEADQPAGMNLANNTGATDYYYIEAVGQANALA